MKTVLFTIVLLLSGTAMATERTRGLLGDMPQEEEAYVPRQPMDPERKRDLDALVEATARRDPGAQALHDAYREKYNVPSVQENMRAMRERWIERERR